MSCWDSKDTSPLSAFRAHLSLSNVPFPEEGRGAGAAEQNHAGSLWPSRDQWAPPPGVCSFACTDAEQQVVSLATSLLGTKGNSQWQSETAVTQQHSLALHPSEHPPCPTEILSSPVSVFTLKTLAHLAVVGLCQISQAVQKTIRSLAPLWHNDVRGGPLQ